MYLKKGVSGGMISWHWERLFVCGPWGSGLLMKNCICSKSASPGDQELPISNVNVAMGEQIFIKCFGYL